MKSILSLVSILLILQLGTVAGGEMPIIQPAGNSCGDGPSQIEGDFPIGQAQWDGQSGVHLCGDCDIQPIQNHNDSAPYHTWAFDEEVFPATVHDEEDLDIWTRMIARKLSKPGSFSPFVAIGAGVMPLSLDGRISVTAPSERFSSFFPEPDSELEACGKLGIGIDFFPAQNVSLGLEGSYVFGFDDLNLDLGFLGDSEIDIVHFIFTLGAAYHF
jgi:hypothetical protein